VKRALYLLDQLRDVVQGKARPEVAEIARRYLEGLARTTGAPLRQPAPQRFVEDLGERPAGAARLGFQLCRQVVVHGESSSRALMLQDRHRDVKERSHSELPIMRVMLASPGPGEELRGDYEGREDLQEHALRVSGPV
jgi:hypothetical protein